MTIKNLSHQIRLDPTCKQMQSFRKACGVARFAWNWALAKWEADFKEGLKPNALALKKEFNKRKKQEFSWVYEVTKYACQQPFIHLDKAFQGFFKKRSCYPKYKKKGVRDSFYIGGDQIRFVENKVKIPNLGWVKLKERLRFEGKITGVTISHRAGYWFISVNVQTDHPYTPCKSQARVGVDLGLKTIATLSKGEATANPRALKNKLHRLRTLQRQLARKEKGSNNCLKAKNKIAKVHYKIANLRKDCLHKLTTYLTENYKEIVIEDLDVSEMVKNKHLSRSIMDVGFYEFRKQLSYKAVLRKNTLVIANRYYASSKRCSNCRHTKDKLPLSERIYHCEVCNLIIDRDLNAALCLEQFPTVSSAGINACGQDGSVILFKTASQPAWMKQELSSV